MKNKKVLVTGTGGFIGSHLVRYLVDKGYWVRGADIKESEFMKTEAHDFRIIDLREMKNCIDAVKDIDIVYNLAANMGGIGFISEAKAEVMRDNVLINVNMLESSRLNGISRFFFSSSACIYPIYKQEKSNILGLKENDAYPADPDNEYGWEKLFTERLCQNYYYDYGLEIRIARFHNIYGPYGTWKGGREKSPAAICRKVVEQPDGGSIEIWGDGKQSRSYCYISDCLDGIYKLTNSDYREPLNIGSDRLVTIDALADIVIQVSGKKIGKKYNTSAPQGVRGRNADLDLVKKTLDWQPRISLEEGLRNTYEWIKSQIK